MKSEGLGSPRDRSGGESVTCGLWGENGSFSILNLTQVWHLGFHYLPAHSVCSPDYNTRCSRKQGGEVLGLQEVKMLRTAG